MPTPIVGWPLPRVADAYMTAQKLNWIFARHGHGPEWARAFHVGDHDAELVWRAIVEAVVHAPAFRVIDRGSHGMVCGVVCQLTLNTRKAAVTSWHYASKDDAPRLVTAYPTL